MVPAEHEAPREESGPEGEARVELAALVEDGDVEGGAVCVPRRIRKRLGTDLAKDTNEY